MVRLVVVAGSHSIHCWHNSSPDDSVSEVVLISGMLQTVLDDIGLFDRCFDCQFFVGHLSSDVVEYFAVGFLFCT